ncbi:MAG: helix-turn-helix transcriptional regulator [Chloroflexaceae bacterium]|nr:helix-turn-helix transcriptional regulator [Chloroflexaceae bacterium]
MEPPLICNNSKKRHKKQWVNLEIFTVFCYHNTTYRNDELLSLTDYMNRKDFGQLVAALRREQTDDAGKQWTQEQLSQEASLDIDVLGNIERGRRAYLGAEMLLSLANAFRLTNEERKEFFLAAHAFDQPETIYRESNDPQVALRELVRRVEHTALPAYLIDHYCDILACNQVVLNLLGLTPDHLRQTTDHPIVAANMMRFVFAPEFDQREYMPHWHTFAYQNIMIFRTLSLRYRTEPYFQSLITELRKWPLFRRYWFKLYEDIERDPVVNNETIVTNSPLWGALSYFSTSCAAMTSAGALMLYVYVPADTSTADVFTDISRQSEQVVHQFVSWPEKAMP